MGHPIINEVWKETSASNEVDIVPINNEYKFWKYKWAATVLWDGLTRTRPDADG